LNISDFSKEEILKVLDLAKDVKENPVKYSQSMENETLLMMFEKPSLRTRLSFEAAMTELGGHAIYLDSKTTQFALTDFGDEIQAVMRFAHALMFRAKKASDVIKAASFNRIPVIDACSEKYHPAQAMSDLLTMAEKSGGIENVKKVVWLGIENNVSNTLMLACVKLGIHFVIVAPEIDQDSIDVWQGECFSLCRCGFCALGCICGYVYKSLRIFIAINLIIVVLLSLIV